MSIIYKTTNLVNGKIYVGQHYTSADDGYLGSGTYFKSILKEFGKENFIRETLEFCTKQDLNNKERYWVKKLKANDPEIGYNRTVGGQTGWDGKEHPMFGKHLSDEWKQKISKSQKGQHRSSKTKQKISQSKKGILRSNETKKKISNSLKGINHPMYGKRGFDTPNFCKKFSKSHKEKLSKSHKGIAKSKNNPMNKYDFKCSNDINFWEYFTLNEKAVIREKFRRKQTNIITYKGIIIKQNIVDKNK